MSNGWTNWSERTLDIFLVNYSKETMFIEPINTSSMIKMDEKIFELLDKWVKQVDEENVIQVMTDNHSSCVMTGKKSYLNFLKLKLFLLKLVRIYYV